MKTSTQHSLLFFGVLPLFWVGALAYGQGNPLEDKQYEPSATVVKGTISALSDDSEEVVVLALRSLGEWKHAPSAVEVVKLIGDASPAAVRMEALEYLVRLGAAAKPQVPEVLKYVRDPDPNIRIAVLRVLYEAKASQENLATIVPLLGDTRGDVRVAAANCIGQSGNAANTHREAMLKALSSAGSPEFKAAALHAITQIGGSAPAELDLIVPLTRDQDAEVRVAAWAATLSDLSEGKASGKLSEEKDKAVREALIAQFRVEPPEIKSAIIENVGKYKAAAAASVAALVNQIRSDTIEVRAAALRVLGKAGAEAMGQTALIVERAKDPDSTVRAAAIAALGSLGPDAVKPNVAVIAIALLDPSDLVRDEALAALPAGGEALRQFPYKVADVYPTASTAVRATLIKALPVTVRTLGMDADSLSRARAALRDPNADVRIGICFVMGQLGSKLAGEALPQLLDLLKDPEVAVRGAAAISLRSFVTDEESKQTLRKALQPLLKDPESRVRWAALDTIHDLDPGKDPDLVTETASLLKDEEQSVRSAAVRALGAAGSAAKPHLLEIIRFFNDDPSIPPYTAAEAVLEMSPLSLQELTSLLHPLYVYSELRPLTRVTAYSASGGDPNALLLLRLLARTNLSAKEIVPAGDSARAVSLLNDALQAPLLHERLRAEITSRLAQLKGPQ